MSQNYLLIPNGELYHYGVKGMKWGVRRYQNKDGTLTEAGKKRLVNKVEKTMRSKNVPTPAEAAEPLSRDRAIKRAYKLMTASNAKRELDEAHEFEVSFHNNAKLVDEYREKAATRIGKERGWSKEEIAQVVDSFKNDDGDFGHAYSFSEYCRDKGVDEQRYRKKCQDTLKAYSKACDDYAKEWLGSCGDKTVWELTTQTGYHYQSTATEIVSNTLRIMGDRYIYDWPE